MGTEGVLAEVVVFVVVGPTLLRVAWAEEPARPPWLPAQWIACAGASPRCHRLAPSDGARGKPLHGGSDIRPVASGLHADAVCGCPAGPGCDSAGQIYAGGVAVGTMTAIMMTLVSGPFYGAASARARSGSWRCFVAWKLLLPIAFAMRGIPDQCIRVESDLISILGNTGASSYMAQQLRADFPACLYGDELEAQFARIACNGIGTRAETPLVPAIATG